MTTGARVVGELDSVPYANEWVEFQAENGERNGEIPQAFKDNVDTVVAHNLQLDATYTLSYTGPFADLTEEEFIAQYTGLGDLSLTPQDSPSFDTNDNSDVVADAVDWVAEGKVNPIKNQGQCGSCWAFSTMGTLESGYAISSGKLVSLAEQQLVDCDRNDNGCSGGWPHTAYDSYLSGVGVCSEDSYSYTARDGSCRASSCTAAIPSGVVTGHSNVGSSSSGLKSTLSQQPVSVTVNAGQLQLYGNGVVTGNCQGQINHAVIAVGYGTDGQDYFKIRNSWGTSWGEQGYIRLAQDGGSQGTACLFQYSPVVPTLSTTVQV
jgi:C1A family cysteine protease